MTTPPKRNLSAADRYLADSHNKSVLVTPEHIERRYKELVESYKKSGKNEEYDNYLSEVQSSARKRREED